MSGPEIRPGGDLDVLHYYVGWRVVVTLWDGEIYMGRIARLTDTELEISSLQPDVTPGRIPLQHEDIDRISVRHEPWLPPSAEDSTTERMPLLKRVRTWFSKPEIS